MGNARFPGERFSHYKERLAAEKKSLKAYLRGSWFIKHERPLPNVSRETSKKPSENSKIVQT